MGYEEFIAILPEMLEQYKQSGSHTVKKKRTTHQKKRKPTKPQRLKKIEAKKKKLELEYWS